MTIRVLVCNRINLYAESLQRLLEEDGEIRVAGIACDEQDLEGLEVLAPDLIITDAAGFPRVAGPGKKIILLWDGPQALPLFSELKEMVDR